MRHGRAKAARKTLQFYRLNAPHILKSPYKLLLDGTFLVASIRNKVPLYERFAKILQNEQFICCVTRSTLNELEKLSQQFQCKRGANTANEEEEQINFFSHARQFGLDECEIIEDAKIPNKGTSTNDTKRNKVIFRDFSDASKDIYNLATDGGNNRQSYFVSTQDDALADALRAMPYVPLFRLGRAVLLLESPSSASRSFTGNKEQFKLASAGGLMTSEERQMVKAVKKKDKLKRKEVMIEEQKKLEKRTRDEVGGSFNMRRKKKARGPNPLSCKRKK